MRVRGQRVDYHGLSLYLDEGGRSWVTVCDADDCYINANQGTLRGHGPYHFCSEHYKQLEPRAAEAPVIDLNTVLALYAMCQELMALVGQLIPVQAQVTPK